MKKLFIISALFIITGVKAQFEASISLDGGYVGDKGYLGRLSYTQIINRNQTSKIQGNLIYSATKEAYQSSVVPFQKMKFGLNYLHAILKPKRRGNKISVFAGAGGSVGYETFKAEFQELENGAITQTIDQIIFGVNGVGELSYKLGRSGNTELLLVGKHYYTFNSQYGQNKTYAGIGLRKVLFSN